MKHYLAFDIGCIECGEDSDVVGVFPTRAEAEQSLVLAERWQRQNWSGQHRFVVFEIEVSE